jgi:hypothetical protein
MNNAPPLTDPRPDGASAWENGNGWVLHIDLGGLVLRAEAATLPDAEILLHTRARREAAARGLVISSQVSLSTALSRLRGVL